MRWNAKWKSRCSANRIAIRANLHPARASLARHLAFVTGLLQSRATIPGPGPRHFRGPVRPTRSRSSACLNLSLAVTIVIAACSGGKDSAKSDSGRPVGNASPSAGVDLTGAGATFPYPIYSKWVSDYAAKTGIKINYQSIGSGGGIQQLCAQTVDFGASDAPMSDAEIANAKGGPVLHIPTVLGAVVITYNVPGVTQQLK